MIAKFPHLQDAWEVIAWEWVMLEMAAEAGIRVPAHELMSIDDQSVLLTERFDRKKEKRLGYISATTLLGRVDGEPADYSEIALALRDVSAAVRDDLEELFRRIAFSILVNNTDDHPRNHGLIRNGSGWRLSPVFDVNPDPEIASVRATSVFGISEKKAALAALVSGAAEFDLSHARAGTIIEQVRAAMRSHEKYATAAGISQAEQARFRWIWQQSETA
jgi:serine/threonine-protein kinase HipA